MPKTLKRWIITTLIGVPATIVLWWNAPKVINSDVWWLGFAMEGGAIVFYPVSVFRVFRRLRYAESIACQVYADTDQWLSLTDCLDVPYLTESQYLEAIEVYKDDPTLFESPLDVLINVSIHKELKG